MRVGRCERERAGAPADEWRPRSTSAAIGPTLSPSPTLLHTPQVRASCPASFPGPQTVKDSLAPPALWTLRAPPRPSQSCNTRPFPCALSARRAPVARALGDSGGEAAASGRSPPRAPPPPTRPTPSRPAPPPWSAKLTSGRSRPPCACGRAAAMAGAVTDGRGSRALTWKVSKVPARPLAPAPPRNGARGGLGASRRGASGTRACRRRRQTRPPPTLTDPDTEGREARVAVRPSLRVYRQGSHADLPPPCYDEERGVGLWNHAILTFFHCFSIDFGSRRKENDVYGTCSKACRVKFHYYQYIKS